MAQPPQPSQPPQDPGPPGPRPHHPRQHRHAQGHPGQPGQQPPKEKSKLPWILGGAGCGCGLLVIGAVVVVLLAMGVISMPTLSPPTLEEQRAAAVRGGEFTDMSVTEECEHVAVTVNAVGTGVDSVQDRESGGTLDGVFDQFIVVQLDVENLRDEESILAPWSSFDLVASSGEELGAVSTSRGVMRVAGLDDEGSIGAGDTRSYMLVYDVTGDVEPEGLMLPSSNFVCDTERMVTFE